MTTTHARITEGVRARTLTKEFTIQDSRGIPLAHRDVEVEQTAHAFGFGCIAFDLLNVYGGEPDSPLRNSGFGGAHGSDAAMAVEPWFELFNTATLPFYWRTFEPQRGNPDTGRFLAAAHALKKRGITIKGHPLLWHTLAPQWLKGLSVDDTKDAIRQRIHREVTDFADLVDMWDAINETVILPSFNAEENRITQLAQETSRIEVMKLAFEAAREVKSDVKLVLNDFNLSDAYERVIEEALQAGITIDAIGLQTHMHQGYRGEDAILEVLDRFEKFGLPLQFTETTLVSGHIMPPEIIDLNDYQIPEWPSTAEGEARQAEEIERHYRTVLSHPLVESLNYWGIIDPGAWLGAPVGLIRADGSKKPSYEVLHSLIKGEWWHEPRIYHTDEEGRAHISGWAGEYQVRCGAASREFSIDANSNEQVIIL